MAHIQFSSSLRLGLVASLAFALAGCDGGEVKVYKVAKEASPPSAPGLAAMPPMAASEGAAQAPLTWTLPAGWQEVKPGPMRLAQFAVAGPGGKKAEVSIVMMGGTAGGELGNVNRWRGQVSLSPVTEAEVSKLGEKTEAAGSETKLYDMTGMVASGDKARILVTSLQRGDEAWFFKMTGDDELVAAQKPAFLAFLKSLKFSQTSPAPEATAALPPDHPSISGGNAALPADHPPIGGALPPAQSQSADPTKPSWTIPSGWTEVPATAMLLAKFSIGQDAARADITVSSFDGDVGGLTANVNRWRGQISLAPIDDAAASQAVTPVEVSGEKGSLVDMNGTDAKNDQPARLIGVAVPHGGRTWFFKILGDGKVVASERDAFLKFVQTVKLPHAP